jgi:DNA-binding MarR family transcriptional regulator
MQKSATAENTEQKPARKQTPKPRTEPRAPLTPDHLAALDVLFAAAKPGFELALGPAGTEINLSARLKRAKRYGYGAPTGVLFLDALRALDGLTRTEMRVLLGVLARAPFGDNVVPISAAAIAREIGLDRSHAAAAIRSLARAGILIEDEASKGSGRKFYRLNHGLIWRGGAYGKHAAQAARPAPPIRVAR